MVSVIEVNVLQSYIKGVMKRVDHHGPNVDEVIFALAGAIVWKKDHDKNIEVRAIKGRMGNVPWVHIANKPYAFSYNHETGNIEMRKNNLQGQTLHTFNNSTSISEIREAFQSL